MIDYENLNKLNKPFEKEFKIFFEKFLNSGTYILSDQVTKFEEEFSNFLNIENCLGVGNGLDAMVLSLKALEFKAGGEVIVPSNTYIATIIAILRAELKPVLVEPDIDTYNIDTNLIEESINSNTVAILPVHLYGLPCDMDGISRLAKKYNLSIIEDCAQSHGAKFKGRDTGTFGEFGCFSFYPTKNLGALGDAGAIVTNNPNLASKCKSLRNYGSEKKYHNKYLGFNSRLDELQAGFLRIKLKHLDRINKHKRELAEVYFENLSDSCIKPHVDPDYLSVFHIFPIRIQDRDGLRAYLKKNGINTDIHYPIPPHRQKGLEGLIQCDDYSLSQEIHDTILSLPISLIHSKEQILSVCKMINNYTK